MFVTGLVRSWDTGKTNALNLIKLEAYASLIFSLLVLDPTGRHNDTLWREYSDVCLRRLRTPLTR